MIYLHIVYYSNDMANDMANYGITIAQYVRIYSKLVVKIDILKLICHIFLLTVHIFGPYKVFISYIELKLWTIHNGTYL